MKQGITLTELAQTIEANKERKRDLIVPSPRMSVVTAMSEDGKGGTTKLLIDPEDPALDPYELDVLQHAHRQVGQHWKVRADFYDRLRADHPPLFDNLINGLMMREPHARMVRTYSATDTDPAVARAVLSNSYRRLDYEQVAEYILPVLQRIPDVQIVSCALTEERMYIKAVAPHTALDLGDLGGPEVGDIVQAGVVIKNSEVGSGMLSVEDMVYRLWCKNGMTRPGEIKVRHVGRRIAPSEDFSIYREETLRADDRAIMLKARDAVGAAVDSVRFRQLASQFAATGSTTPMENPVEGVKVLAKTLALSEGESQSVLKHLAAGGDLTKFGALNAVTRTAEDVESYDRASELESLGFKVLAMPTPEWDRIAAAA